MTASVRAVKERPQPPLQPGDRQVARLLQQKTARAKRDIREMPSSHSMRFDSDPNPGGLRGGILRQLAKSRVTGPLNVLSPCRPVCVSRSRRDAERGPRLKAGPSVARVAPAALLGWDGPERGRLPSWRALGRGQPLAATETCLSLRGAPSHAVCYASSGPSPREEHFWVLGCFPQQSQTRPRTSDVPRVVCSRMA